MKNVLLFDLVWLIVFYFFIYFILFYTNIIRLLGLKFFFDLWFTFQTYL